MKIARVVFYMLNALPDAQLTVSQKWIQSRRGWWYYSIGLLLVMEGPQKFVKVKVTISSLWGLPESHATVVEFPMDVFWIAGRVNCHQNHVQ